MDTPYTAVAVKGGASVMLFFFRSTPCLLLEVQLVKIFLRLKCSFQMKNFEELYRIIPTELPKEWLISASSFI